MTTAARLALHLATEYEGLAARLRTFAADDDTAIAATLSSPPPTQDPGDALHPSPVDAPPTAAVAPAPATVSTPALSAVLKAVPPREQPWVHVGDVDGESHRWPDPDGVVHFSSFEIYETTDAL